VSIATYSIGVLCMILLPVILAALLRRRYQVPWIVFCLGALTFVASQAVHLPLNSLLERIGLLPSGAAENVPLWQTALVLGLTAGVCEELARAATYAIARRWRRYEDAVMIGLGHGGIESMLIGGVLTATSVSSLLALGSQDLSSLGLPVEQVQAVLAQSEVLRSSPELAILPVLERLAALGLHVSMSVLVLQAFTRHNPAWVGAAIAAHAAFDALALVLSQRVSNGWIIECTLLAASLLPIYWAWRQRPANAPRPECNPIGRDLSLLWVCVRKELTYLWRTRRVLVVVAVFTTFGLTSPLLARFTPEILSSIEGAEQFSDLIPTPTVDDAIVQYVKNLSQFGFLIVVVVGMDLVAGEKERRTASLVLSKPLPRWAFIAGKFAAQFILYLGAFAIAMLAGYYYTTILFEPISPGAFALQNGLLLLWLMVLAAMTLLGSTLASSTALAAALGLGGCVALLLAGSLPKVGALAPGGLLAWVSQMGAGKNGVAVGANGGAMAMAVALIVLALITSIAVFETQELD